MNMHLHPNFLGLRLINSVDGSSCVIVAAWLEDNSGARPTFVVLTVNEAGTFYKMSLPHLSMSLAPVSVEKIGT